MRNTVLHTWDQTLLLFPEPTPSQHIIYQLQKSQYVPHHLPKHQSLGCILGDLLHVSGQQKSYDLPHKYPYSTKLHFFFPFWTTSCSDLWAKKLSEVHCSQITPGSLLTSQTQRLGVLRLPRFCAISHQSSTLRTS